MIMKCQKVIGLNMDTNKKSIAGVKPVTHTEGKVASTVSPVTHNVIVEPNQELFRRKDVYEIIKKFYWFTQGFNTAQDKGDSEERAYLFARYLSGEVDDSYWEGIDVFMNMENNK